MNVQIHFKQVMIMNKISLFFFAFTLFTGFTATGFCNESQLSTLINNGVEELGIKKGSEDLSVLTNANYVRLSGKTTEKYVDEIAAASGCSVGMGNLLLFNERPHNVLLIALGNKKTQQSFIIRYDGERWTTGTLSLKTEDIEKPDFFLNAIQGVSGRQTFHIVTILGAWMLDAPYDLLRSAELHGHICPGLFFGYIMAKGVEARLPLMDGEKYIYIGSPNECKDDAMQVLLGVTGGKRTMFIKKVRKENLVEIPGRVLTGIVIKWSTMNNRGTGLVMSIDLDAIHSVAEVGKDKPPNKKILAARKLLGQISETDMFFRVEKEFQVDRELKEKLIQAGVNPYEILAMTPAPQ